MALCLFLLLWTADLLATQPPSIATKPVAAEAAKPNAGTSKAKVKAPPKPSSVAAATCILAPAAPKAQAKVLPKTNSAKAVRAKKAKASPPPLISPKTKSKAEAITQEISPALPESVEQEISKFFGLRYRLGGNGQGGIDCSALVQKVYADAFGVSLPRSSSEQSRAGDLEQVPADELKAGDLLFFGSKRKKVDHVGMYLSDGYFLHAARSEGVTISRLDHQHWKARFMFSKRMRGLDLDGDRESSSELEDELSRESAAFAFSGLESGGLLRSLDTGVSLNDSLELILSGYFLNLLSDGPTAEEGSVFDDHVPIESKSTENGFRLAALLSPLEWLGISPSVTTSDRSRTKDGLHVDEPRQKIGLETWMILPSSKVAVFMAAHVGNQDNLLDNPSAISPDWQSVDVALGLNYRLSDSLRFSLYSTHAYLPESRLPAEESGRSKLVMEDVGFQLNIRF